MEVEPTKIWQVVKGLEKNLSKAEQEMGEIRATLFVNFNGSREGLPNLVKETDNTISMLVKVLEHYIKSDTK